MNRDKRKNELLDNSAIKKDRKAGNLGNPSNNNNLSSIQFGHPKKSMDAITR